MVRGRVTIFWHGIGESVSQSVGGAPVCFSFEACSGAQAWLGAAHLGRVIYWVSSDVLRVSPFRLGGGWVGGCCCCCCCLGEH